MNYASLITSSCVDFTGWSTVIQISGCSHACKGCFNKAAWKSSYGQPFTDETYQELLEAAIKPFIAQVVLQGGYSLYRKNVKDTITLCQRLNKDLGKPIVLFTGYTYEQIKEDLILQQILPLVSYIMDGKYEHSLPTTKHFRGSDNQILHTIVDGISISQN